MDISEAAVKLANRRGRALNAACPAAVAVRYDRRADRVVIVLSSGLELGFSPKRAQGLESARPFDLIGAEISPSGFGVHFPRLDADLYIPALLEGLLGSKRWMAQLGKVGGSTSSKAKAAAARRNGKLGGRPKKVPVRARVASV